MRRIIVSAIAIAIATFISGCSPEETFVLVNASALSQAAIGGLASAKVEMVFDVKDKDDPNLPGRVKRVALPYLGAGATIEIEKTEKKRIREGGSIRDEEVEIESSIDNAKIVARFTIPVGTEEVLDNAPRSILWLKYTPSDQSFRLVPGNAVRALNSALSDVNEYLDFEYKGGTSRTFLDASGTTIKIVGDKPVKIGVAAVKVNGKRVIADMVSPDSGAIKINYDNDFYDECAPCFIFGDFSRIPEERLSQPSIWD